MLASVGLKVVTAGVVVAAIGALDFFLRMFGGKRKADLGTDYSSQPHNHHERPREVLLVAGGLLLIAGTALTLMT